MRGERTIGSRRRSGALRAFLLGAVIAGIGLASTASVYAVDERANSAALRAAMRARAADSLAGQSRPALPAIPRIELSDFQGIINARIESVLVGMQPMPVIIGAETFPDDTVLIRAKEIVINQLGVKVIDADGQVYHRLGRFPDAPRADSDERQRAVRRDIVHISSDITVDPDEKVVGNVTAVFGNIIVFGEVTGSVVSVFGRVEIEGKADDIVVAPLGSVRVGSEAHVRGDVVGGGIEKDPGGRIDGQRIEIFLGSDLEMSAIWTKTTLTALIILKILFWLFLALLAHAVACRNIVKVKQRIQARPVKSFFVGLLVQVLFLPGVILLMVTIVGIPVAIFLLPLMVIAALVLAYAAMGLLLGEKIAENTIIRMQSLLARTVVGLFVLQSLSLAAVIVAWYPGIWIGGSTLRMMSLILGGLSIFIGYLVTTVGTGAVVMTRFGTRPKGEIDCDDGSVRKFTGESPATEKPTPLPRSQQQPPPEDDTAPALG